MTERCGDFYDGYVPDNSCCPIGHDLVLWFNRLFLNSLHFEKSIQAYLTRNEMMEIMTWLAVLFLTFMMIKTSSMNLLLPVVVLIIPLINLRRSNRKQREMN